MSGGREAGMVNRPAYNPDLASRNWKLNQSVDIPNNANPIRKMMPGGI